MKRTMTAVCFAIAMVCSFTGCAGFGMQEKTVQSGTIRYTVPSGMQDVTEEYNMLTPAFYHPSGKFLITEGAAMGYSMSTQTKLDWLKLVYNEHEVQSSEIIKDEEYDIIIFTYEDNVDIEDTSELCTSFTLSDKDHPLDFFTFVVSYENDADEQKAREVALSMLRSAEYIGEEAENSAANEEDEKSAAVYDCDYFTYEIPAQLSEQFRLDAASQALSDNSAVVKYTYAEKLGQFFASLQIEVLEDAAYDSAEAYLQDECDALLETDTCTVIKQPYTTDIFGYDAWCMEYENNISSFSFSYTCYAFECNDKVYTITLRNTDYEGSEQAQADLELLLQGFTAK